MGQQIDFGSFVVDPRVEDEYGKAVSESGADPSNLELGRVVQVDRTLPLVCTPRGNVRSEHAVALVKGTDTLAAVGDWVLVEFPPSHENSVIRKILPRRNSLSRPDRRRKGGRQTLASNIDVVFIVVPMKGVSNALEHLERQLTLSFQSGAEPVIVLSKADLADDPGKELEAVKSIALEVPVVVESVNDGRGVGQIESLIPNGRCATLLGKSGVGKSSLVNAIVGMDLQSTNEVRESDGKGRHTTIARRMVLLPNGGFLVDSPGLRSFLLDGSFIGVERAFADIVELSSQCKFRDCRHLSEPGCAVREAVSDGSLSKRRYDSYIAIMEEVSRINDKW
ncbi:MAG: ribosome small subunit-dependent GTPase A [Coriobacteriales bacterium]|jgi:ribosome biogenesis GTPase